jgi:hypothetical protein
MNKLTKIFAGVVLAGSAAMASASPVFLDVIADGDADGDNVTDAFTSFVFNSFTPEHIWIWKVTEYKLAPWCLIQALRLLLV